MLDLGNVWTEGASSQMASYQFLMHDIHVLIVDHETESLVDMIRFFELCQHRVTIVELASAAIQMITDGKVKYDVILANVNSPDLHGYKLVQYAGSMEIPVILMSSDDNIFMATKALENGAYLYVKKPVTTEVIGCLWQHVYRERTRVMTEQDRLAATNYQARAIEFGGPIHQDGENPNNNIRSNGPLMMRDKGKSEKKNKESTDMFNGNIGHFDIDNNNKLKRKVCTEWTQELHAKFMSAVEILGEGRCFPGEILKLMNVPGLKRLQVASHLQKCRNKNWKAHGERRAINQANGVGLVETDGSHSEPRRFGSMPRIGNAMHHNNGVELSSQNRYGTESGMYANMGNQYGMRNNIAHHQVSGSFQPGPSPFSSNGRNQFNEFFNIPGMDCTMVQNFSRMSQGYVMNTVSRNHGHYHYDAALCAGQNSAVANMDTTSPWS